jgi:arginyl-tRNA synthetase
VRCRYSWPKATRQNPLQVAQAIQQYLPALPQVGRVSVSAPGFINIALDRSWLSAQADRIVAAGAGYADLDWGAGKTAQVEYVSANPTGPLSVGRGRGGVLGDTLANVLSAAGYKVTREYYFNNAGRQMQILSDSLRLRYHEALGLPVDFPADYYQGAYLRELADSLVAKHGDQFINDTWESFKSIAEAAMFASIQATLAKLNIHMDVFFNENTLYESAVWDVLADLKQGGFVYEQDGAQWLAATKLGGEEDRVLVRSNGEPTYRLPDIAYHLNKLHRGFDLIVDVLGADHKDEFPDVVRGVQALGYAGDNIHLLMNQFVSVKGEKMSTRAGRFTTLDELIAEVGADVVRYFLLYRDAKSHLEFDLELAKQQSDHNPVYYTQYAHARACSILRKASSAGITAAPAGFVLQHPAEQAVLLRLLELADVLAVVLTNLEPHHLTTYARDLATAFNAFYRDCQVLDMANLEMSQARLQLVRAAQIGLARILGLLGIAAPTEM